MFSVTQSAITFLSSPRKLIHPQMPKNTANEELLLSWASALFSSLLCIVRQASGVSEYFSGHWSDPQESFSDSEKHLENELFREASKPFSMAGPGVADF